MEYETTLTGNEPIAITIGNFDGVHRGHQRLMHELTALAQELHCKPVLVTFSPHTLMVVRPNIHLELLTTLEEKLSLANYYSGIADSIVIHFTPEVAALSANDFLEQLREHFPLRAMVVGGDFSLGHNRMGNIPFLQQYGREHDILVRSIDMEAVERTRISSTHIRQLVSDGKIVEANELLGHPMMVSGVVVRGDRRGRLLGFPTANLSPDPHKLLPANGIYAARVGVGEKVEPVPSLARARSITQSDEMGDIAVLTNSEANDSSHITRPSLLHMLYAHEYDSAVSVGVRPMFDGRNRVVEAYLLDVNLDLYDSRITIDFIDRLRDEERFSDIEALKLQMAADVQKARHVLHT